MSKINYIIPQQNFELVRNRITEILIDEFTNQFILTYDNEINPNIAAEFNKPISKVELPFINVSLIKGSFNDKFYNGSIPGMYQYAIDVYTKSKTTSLQDGTVNSVFKNHRLIGICRAILEDPQYKTLGYNPGFISRVGFSSFEFASPTGEDAENTYMGRLIFDVKVTETTNLLSPTIADGYDTKVKIDNGTNGYQYVTNNYN